jgi:hypothetical protein
MDFMIRHVKLKRRIEKHRQSLAEMHVLGFTWFTLLNADARVYINPACARQEPAQQAVLREIAPLAPRKHRERINNETW